MTTFDQLRPTSDMSEVLDWLCDYGAPSIEQVTDAGLLLGRNSGPAIVASLYYEGHLTREVAAHAVPVAWMMCEWPSRQLDDDEWRDLFDLAGYTHNGVRAPRRRPRKSKTLYRGSLPEFKAGWSWTPDRALAQWFADRNLGSGRKGTLYVAQVPPRALLAWIGGSEDFGRTGEHQYVVDTGVLTIEAHLGGAA